MIQLLMQQMYLAGVLHLKDLTSISLSSACTVKFSIHLTFQWHIHQQGTAWKLAMAIIWNHSVTQMPFVCLGHVTQADVIDLRMQLLLSTLLLCMVIQGPLNSTH